MIPIEAVAVFLWLVFGLVGLSRRFPLELGSTIGLVAMLLLLHLVGARASGLAVRAATALGLATNGPLVQWTFYTLVILVWVLFMYGGQTLSFAGVWPPHRAAGAVVDTLTGLFNGWIVVGSWWHYTHLLGYPIVAWGLFTPPLSARALRLVALAPQSVVPEPFATVAFGGFLVMLIALRVFR